MFAPAVLAVELPDLNSVNYTLGVLGITALLMGWWRGWLESPKRRAQREQNQAIHDAILGQPEQRDRSGTVTQEGRPGLVALQRADSARLGTVEEAVVEFRHLIGIGTELAKRVDNVENRVNVLENSTVKDIIVAAERAATAAASAEMLRLMQTNQDLHDVIRAETVTEETKE